MRHATRHISLLLLIALTLLACDKTPRGVLSMNDMADLIVDLQLADAYMESHSADFESDSSKLVLKQSIFRKHGITTQEYDSSLVWYAHNMEDYTKAYDKAVGKLKHRYDKLDKSGKGGIDEASEVFAADSHGEPTHEATPARATRRPGIRKLNPDDKGDTIDLWQGRRNYLLTQGDRRGFITFDIQPDAAKQSGDRYQLAYRLTRGNNEFKVCLAVDYSDGATSQIFRGTNSDGWVTVDVQSDTTRRVSRVYGYVSYDIKPGHVAVVDSLMLVRTRLNKDNYGFIHAQRLLERNARK